jgi:hypothetical protein
MKLTLTLAVAIIFAACAGKPAEQITFPTTCSASDDKRYVQVAGHLTDAGSVFCSNTGGRMECGFTLSESADGSPSLKVYIAQGSGSSSVEKFERSYKKDDIKIHDKSGALVKLGDQVKLTGKMNALPDGSLCFLTVDTIEK